MKRILLLLSFTICTATLFAQSKVEDLIKEGIGLHDKGDFGEAIRAYKQALALDSNSALANYEISLTYMSIKDFENAFKYSSRSIELDGKDLPAYMVQGSSLDDLGRREEAIKVFEKALKRFGDHHLLYYNLGLTYVNLKNADKAEANLLKAIQTNPSHASSHLLLAQLMRDTNRKVESILGLYYFLLLESKTARSKDAFGLLTEQLKGNVTVDENNERHINILVGADSEFSAAEMMLSMMQAAKTLPEKEGIKLQAKTESEMFIDDTSTFFKTLGELKRKKNKGLYWDLYVPLFYKIAKSKHIDTYCYYISQSSREEAVTWLKEHESRIDGFGQWLQEK